MAEHGERSAALKCKSDRAGHETGDRRRGAYHRHHLAPMGNKRRQGTGRRRRPKESNDAQVPEAPRDRAAEPQEPNRIHPSMGDIPLDKRLLYGGPDILANSARKTPPLQE